MYNFHRGELMKTMGFNSMTINKMVPGKACSSFYSVGGVAVLWSVYKIYIYIYI